MASNHSRDAKGKFTSSCTSEQRFWSLVDKTKMNGCWFWLGAKHSFGHGRFRAGPGKGKMWMAHRFAWFLTNGDIPSGLQVLHKCDNPFCVNPDHLFLGTQADNMADMKFKNRQARGKEHGSALHAENWKRGAKHPQAKFSESQIREIRNLKQEGWTTDALMSRFQVSRSAICRIISRKTYRDVE